MPNDALLYRLQTQLENLEATVRSLRAGGDDSGGAAVSMGVTFMEGTTYPAGAAAYYSIHAAQPGGVEQEGSAGTATVPGGAAVIHAMNIGGAIPAIGTTVLYWSIGPRWVFRHDG